MKKASLKIIICLLVVLALGTVLAACNKYTPDRYDYRVTFDYNEGISGEEDSLTKEEIKEQYIGLFANSLIAIRPGYTDFPETSISGYYVEGWYTAQTNADGEPLVDEKGFVLLDKKWDFKADRVTKDKVDGANNLTLYANLQKQATITFIDRVTGKVSDTVMMAKPNTEADEPTLSSVPKLEGYTMLVNKDGKINYYKNLEGTEEFKWPYTFGTTNETVYVDFVEGENLNFVYTKSDFVSAVNKGGNIYLMNSLDFTGEKTFWAAGAFYNGELNGRGFTIKGLERKLSASRRDYESKGGIFGTIGSSAYIHDITFADCNVSYTYTSGTPINWYVGLFAWKSEEGARVENVTVSGKFSYVAANGGIIGSAGVANDEGDVNDGIDFSGVDVTVED